MLNGTFDDVRRALAAHAEYGTTRNDVADALAEAAQALLDELEQPTNLQALALARLMRDRPNERPVIYRHAADAFVMANYWSVTFEPSGFECGIAPDGSVSS